MNSWYSTFPTSRMASQYVLAKRDYFNSLLRQRPSTVIEPIDQDKKMVISTSVENIAQENDPVNESVTEIVELLPKTYRSRASALLRILRPRLKIGAAGLLSLVVQQQEFENLYDLLFWLFTSTNVVRVQRPTNAFDFIQTLISLKIPNRLLSTKDVFVRKVQRSLNKYRKKRR